MHFIKFIDFTFKLKIFYHHKFFYCGLSLSLILSISLLFSSTFFLTYRTSVYFHIFVPFYTHVVVVNFGPKSVQPYCNLVTWMCFVCQWKYLINRNYAKISKFYPRTKSRVYRKKFGLILLICMRKVGSVYLIVVLYPLANGDNLLLLRKNWNFFTDLTYFFLNDRISTNLRYPSSKR